MNAREIIDRLRAAHPEPRWAFFEELRCSTGFSYGRDDVEQRIDAWAMDTWDAKRAVAFEVKTSRSDWLRELKAPNKRLAAMRRSELFWFAAPQGLIRPNEVPEGCGLIEVAPRRLLRTVRAPRRPMAELDRGFIAMIMRRQYRHDREAIRADERARIDDWLADYSCLHKTDDGLACPTLHKYRTMWCPTCCARWRRDQRAAVSKEDGVAT